MKKGLVLEGGAMRGMFTAGVIDVWMENGITFDGIVGVSAGAAFGCNYKSNQPGRVIRYNTTYCRDPRYCGFRSLIRTGDFYGADFCYHELPEKLDIFDAETFRNSPMEFYAVCTDVDTGEAVYHKCEDAQYADLEWIRASASMPMVSRVVEVGGKRLLDGGIADSIPLQFFQEIGYGRNVVVLTQPEGYVKKENRLLPLMRITLKKYPKLLETLARRHDLYNEAIQYIQQQEQAGNTLVIRPSAPLPLSRTERDPEKLRHVYELGRQAGLARLEEVRAF